jgi:hypothetical protein
MSVQEPTASDLAGFIQTIDARNSDLQGYARNVRGLGQLDPNWNRDFTAYMTRWLQARERAAAKISAAGGAPLDSVPAPGEWEALQRAVKIYEAAQSHGDLSDLESRARRAAGMAGAQVPHMNWAGVRQKLNAAGAVPALDVINAPGPDVDHSIAVFQASVGLPSSGRLTRETLTYLAAHGENEKRTDTWKARFGGASRMGAESVAELAQKKNRGIAWGWMALGAAVGAWAGAEVMGKKFARR